MKERLKDLVVAFLVDAGDAALTGSLLAAQMHHVAGIDRSRLLISRTEPALLR